MPVRPEGQEKPRKRHRWWPVLLVVPVVLLGLLIAPLFWPLQVSLGGVTLHLMAGPARTLGDPGPRPRPVWSVTHFGTDGAAMSVEYWIWKLPTHRYTLAVERRRR